MERHLDEQALEALSGGRPDLVDEAAETHLATCAHCQALVRESMSFGNELGAAFRESLPQIPDLDARIERALKAEPMAVFVRPSWGALAIAAALGLTATLVFAVLSLPAPAALLSLGRELWAISSAVDRLVELAIPGGWALVACAGLVLLTVIALPMYRLLGLSARPTAFDTVLSVLSIAGLFFFLGLDISSAHALELEGQWPSSESSVTVSVENQPVSEAMRQAAQSAGLGYVARVSLEEMVTLHVENGRLADVVQALLGDAPVIVHRTETMLTVRAANAGDSEPATPASKAATPSLLEKSPPPAPTSSPLSPPSPSAPSAPVRDRATFGSDIRIGPGERVKNVVTMGGDVDVEGEVMGDVTTMGGDATVLEGGTVHGDLVTMGGDLTVHEGGAVHGELVTMGGEISVTEGGEADNTRVGFRANGIPFFPNLTHHGEGGDARVGRWVKDTLASAATHGLLFLFGLVLLFAAPQRLMAIRGAVARSPVRSGVTGLLGAVGAVVLTVVLTITIIGIPGALLVVVGAFLAANVGMVAAASLIGAALPISALKDRHIVQLGAGVAAIFVTSLVPFVGDLLVLLACAVGTGAVLLTRGGRLTPSEI